MTYDHNYTTHQERESSEEEIYLCMILWWRREVQNLSIPILGGCAVFEAWENWGVTVPGFLMVSDIMRCNLVKACMQECFAQFQKRKRKLKIVVLEKCRASSQRNFLMLYISFFKHNPLEHKRHPCSLQGGSKKFFHTEVPGWLRSVEHLLILGL